MQSLTLEEEPNPSAGRPTALVCWACLMLNFAAAGTLGAETSGDPEEEPVYDLETTVVTASGFEQTIQQAPASISVITAEELETRPFVDLTDALQEVPGAHFSQGKVGNDVGLRGMPSDYTLILVDGRRQDSREARPNGFDSAQTGFIPPLSAIERIEVVRGPMSTLYGSDAMGGVINIITKKVADVWGGSVTFDQTFNQHSSRGDATSGNFYVNGPIVEGLLGLAIYGGFYKREEDDMGVDGASPGRRGVRRADHDNVTARLSWTPTPEQDVTFEAGTSVQRFEGTSGKTGTVGEANAYEQLQRYSRDHVALSHTGRWDIGISDISLMHDWNETRGRLNNDGSARPLKIENTVFDAKMIFPLERHFTTVGFQYWEAEMEDGLRGNSGNPVVGDLSMQQHSVFGENEWSILQNLRLTLGLRWDDHDTAGDHFSPRAYLVWNVTPNLALKGGVSEGFKAPRMTQKVDGIRGLGRQGTIPLLGNPDLQPETSRTYEIGVHYTNLLGWDASLTGFFNEFDDKLSSEQILNDGSFPDFPTAPYFSRPINVDTAETYGVEASLRVPLSDDWSLRNTYTWTETKQTSGPNKGDPLTEIPEHRVTSSLNWQATERISAFLRGTWRGSQWQGPDLPKASGYAIFDIGGSYQVNETLTVNAGILNLADKDTTDTDQYAIIEEGRRLWLSATLNF